LDATRQSLGTRTRSHAESSKAGDDHCASSPRWNFHVPLRTVSTSAARGGRSSEDQSCGTSSVRHAPSSNFGSEAPAASPRWNLQSSSKEARVRGEGVAKERVSAETASIGRSSGVETSGSRGDFASAERPTTRSSRRVASSTSLRCAQPCALRPLQSTAALCRSLHAAHSRTRCTSVMCYFIGVGLWIASVAACSALALFHEGPCYFEYNNKTGSALSLWVLLLSIGCSGVCFVVWLVDDRKPRRKNDDDQRGLLAV
jgi:hypothetical protein